MNVLAPPIISRCSRGSATTTARISTRWAWGSRRAAALFEFWAHEASLLPLASQPLLRWRMAGALEGTSKGTLQKFRREKAAYIEEVRRQVEARGPIAASDLADGGAKRGLVGWNDGKLALEWLFFAGS